MQSQDKQTLSVADREKLALFSQELTCHFRVSKAMHEQKQALLLPKPIAEVEDKAITSLNADNTTNQSKGDSHD